MTTRKVTAIEEKVLAAARKYADALYAYRRAVDAAETEFGIMGCALRPEPSRLWEYVPEAEQALCDAARLLKQRRAKGA